MHWPAFKKKCFCCINFEGSGAIKGIGLLFLSLYLVVVTAPQADLGKGMMVAREWRRFGCRSMNPHSKPVRLFRQKPVKMILMASFLNSHPSNYKSIPPPSFCSVCYFLCNDTVSPLGDRFSIQYIFKNDV